MSFPFDARWLVAVFLCSIRAFGAPAAQQEGANPTVIDPAETPEAQADHRLVWRYPRFRLWQYISNGSVSLLNIYAETIQANASSDSWKRPILFDRAARSWLRADTPDGRARADRVSDFLWYGGQYFPFVDGIVAPLASDDLNTDVAWQLSMINWQVVGFSALVTRAAHLWGGRARPSHTDCSDEPGSELPCTGGSGFFSGHTSMTMASAGATCAHHLALPLWGHPVADATACGLLVADGVAVGVLRMRADKHWASDVLTGFVVGSAIGFLTPWLLHYQLREPNDETSGLPHDVMLLPWANDEAVGVSAAGRL
jgi:membrane-associated phospholipid phosphatase